jgi:transcriptional regulator with XRE-family HTH domain
LQTLKGGTCGTPGDQEESGPDWRAWMRGLGHKVRRTREAARLSQSDLAAEAGVSQGAISRLETGRGLATPLLVVLKTAIALRDRMRHVCPEALPREMAFLVESLARHVGAGGRYEDSEISVDPSALELVSTYRSLPDDQRQKLLDAARRSAAESGLANGSHPRSRS